MTGMATDMPMVVLASRSDACTTASDVPHSKEHAAAGTRSPPFTPLASPDGLRKNLGHRGLSVDSAAAAATDDVVSASGPLRQPESTRGRSTRSRIGSDLSSRRRHHERYPAATLCTIVDTQPALMAIDTTSILLGTDLASTSCEDEDADDGPSISDGGMGARAFSVDSGLASMSRLGIRSPSQRFRSRRGSHERQLLCRLRERHVAHAPELPSGGVGGGEPKCHTGEALATGSGRPAAGARSIEKHGDVPALAVVHANLPHVESV